MKHLRAVCVALLIGLLAIAPGAMASTTQEILSDGIVSFEESGDLVALIQVRLRELGYFHFKPTGNFQGMTRNSAIAFQTYQEDENGSPFIADGTIGAQSMGTLFSAKAVRAPIAQDVHIPKGKDADGTQTHTGDQTPWLDVKNKLTAGSTYTLIDFNTGASFQIVYTGGEQHAEVECATKEDTAKFKQIFGDAYSYFKRPMLLTFNESFIACSLQGQPHGEDTMSGNDMPGHACLFFFESKSHVGALQDVEHRDNVYTAAGNAQ